MSIAFERNNGSSIQRMRCGSVYESPEAKAFTGDRRFPVEQDEGSSSSSSIGRNSDVSGGSSDGDEDSNEAEVQSSYKGPFDTLDALEVVLPIKRGISKFYNGKSKSFTSLADASSALSIKDLAKPEDPYTRKRKNLLAHNNFLGKNHISHFRSNVSWTSKKPANSGRKTLAMGMTMKSTEINDKEVSNSMSLSHSHQLPPLHPQCKRYIGNGSPPSPPERSTPCRSFSLSDLQCAAATNHNITGLSFHGEEVDNKQY